MLIPFYKKLMKEKTHKENHNSYSHILKYTGLFGGVQGLNILASMVKTKLVALILGPNGIGLISLFNSTMGLVGNATGFGLPVGAVKKISEAYDSGDETEVRETVKLVRSWSLFVALLGTFVCIILSPLLSRYTFSWEGHTLHFICLAPAVGLTALAGGEVAILKGIRKLRQLAESTVYTSLLGVVLAVPIYYIFGVAAIVPSLVLLALVNMIVVCVRSYHFYPLELSFNKNLLKKGRGMLRLGTGFMIAGIFGAGSELIVKSFLNNMAQIEEVGLYNAGYMMTITYTGMVFSAMETDYFPRLSAIGSERYKLNQMVNRQIEVTLLLLAPMLVAFMVSLPLLLPLLYSKSFLPAIGMMQFMVLAIYLRAVKLPLAYLPLAKGDALLYLIMEGAYAVFYVALTIFFYLQYGLSGVGIAILVCAVIDFMMLYVTMHFKYGYGMSRKVARYILLQFPVGILAYGVTYIQEPIVYWTAGCLLTILSTWISFVILRRKTSLWKKLKKRVRGK